MATTLILDPRAHMDNARVLVRQKFTCGNEITIQYSDSYFCLRVEYRYKSHDLYNKYEGMYSYEKSSIDKINAIIWQFLESSLKYDQHTSELVPFHPTVAAVSETREALKALLLT